MLKLFALAACAISATAQVTSKLLFNQTYPYAIVTSSAVTRHNNQPATFALATYFETFVLSKNEYIVLSGLKFEPVNSTLRLRI